MRKWFYGVMITVVLVLFGQAAITTANGMAEDTSGYPSMSLADRKSELSALRKEIDNPNVDWNTYFEMLSRFDRLMMAAKKARANGDGETMSTMRGEVVAVEPAQVQFFTQEYINTVQRKLPLDEGFFRAKEASGYDSSMLLRPSLPMNPAVPKMWAVFYGMLMLLTLGHFWLRIKEMGGNFAMMAVDPRFLLWLGLCPVGIFRYPTPIDVRSAALRAYRLAALALSSLITVTAAGCAGKKVKTGADEGRVEDAHTLHIDAATKAWPSYIGSNGAVFHDSPVAQTIVMASKSGVYGGAWFSVPVTTTGVSPNYGRELDLLGGWAGTKTGMNMDFGVTFIGVTPVGKYRGDVLMFSAMASLDVDVGFCKISPYFSFQQASPVIGGTPAAGYFLREGVRWSGQRGRFSGRANVELVRDSGAFGFQSGYLAQGGAEVSAKFGKWSVGMPIRFGKPLSTNITDRKRELQAGISLATRIR